MALPNSKHAQLHSKTAQSRLLLHEVHMPTAKLALPRFFNLHNDAKYEFPRNLSSAASGSYVCLSLHHKKAVCVLVPKTLSIHLTKLKVHVVEESCLH